MSTMSDARKIGVLVFPGACLLDLAGPLEVFAEANQRGRQYEVQTLSSFQPLVLAAQLG